MSARRVAANIVWSLGLIALGCANTASQTHHATDIGETPDVPLLDVARDMIGTNDAGVDVSSSDATSINDRVRLIYPLSTVAVTSPRPRLRWTEGATVTSFTVRICGDRACSQVEQTIQTDQREVRPSSDLRPGPHFWRVEATREGVTETSFTWLFRVIAGRSTLDTFFDGGPDFNGDGISDLIAHDDRTGNVRVFYGTRERRLRQETEPVDNRYGALTCLWGDMNGDGLSDAFFGRGHGNLIVYQLYAGTPEGLRPTSVEYINRSQMPLSGFVGDLNGDGRGEWLFFSDYSTDEFLPTERIQLSGGHLHTLVGPTVPASGVGVAPPSDLDSDGLADVVLGAGPLLDASVLRVLWGDAMIDATSGRAVQRIFGGMWPSRLDGRCDIDGDGRLDVSTSYPGYFSWLSSNAMRVMTIQTLTLSQGSIERVVCLPERGTPAQLLVAPQNGRGFRILQWNPQRQSIESVREIASSSVCRGIFTPGDLDGDGYFDAVCISEQSRIVYGVGSPNPMIVAEPGLSSELYLPQ